MPRQRLVIVGNGMAAARLLEELVARGGTSAFQIAVFGEEPCPSYDRLQLADVMNGAQSVAQVLHVGPSWYAERGIRVHLGERAVLVSRQARTVYGSAGTEERYDALVFATGSSPHFPPIKQLFNASGKRLPGVCDFRTLADCTQIMALASGARGVAVIGGGAFGLEAARGLAGRVPRVDVVHRSGVDALLGEERVRGVVLNDGTQLDCDLVVVATGLIPNTWLGYQCGSASSGASTSTISWARWTIAAFLPWASVHSAWAEASATRKRFGSRPRCWRSACCLRQAQRP